MQYIKRLSKRRICTNCNQHIEAGAPAYKEDADKYRDMPVMYFHCEGECHEKTQKLIAALDEGDD